MWCAPRTVSTALLRSFVQRSDTTGIDEPFYAYYLQQTGKTHPMQDEVLAAQSQSWEEVVGQLFKTDFATPVVFIKHMAHHLVGDLEPAAFLGEGVHNAFLIRRPEELLPSLHKALGRLLPADTAYEQQLGMLRYFQAAGQNPLVLDSRDIQENPSALMQATCKHLGLEFESAMLKWSPGRHPAFGVWAAHWYKNVEASSGFQPYKPKTETFPQELRELLSWAQPIYEDLAAHRLQPVQQAPD